MAQMTHEEAIAKAVKLLKLAQSDNPNEAALAAARAQEIMDRYKLEGLSADYNSAAPAEPDEPIVAFGEPVEPKQGSEWVVRLILALARANQCRIYQRRTIAGTGLSGRTTSASAPLTPSSCACVSRSGPPSMRSGRRPRHATPGPSSRWTGPWPASSRGPQPWTRGCTRT